MVGTLIENVIVTSSNIQASQVDMNKNKITSVAIPTEPLDAANKYYVDRSLAQAYQSFQVYLLGTLAVEVVNLTRGSYQIMVQSEADEGPVAQFTILKTSDVKEGIVNGFSDKADSGERLEVSWPSMSALLLRKTGDNHDGLYTVKIV